MVLLLITTFDCLIGEFCPPPPLGLRGTPAKQGLLSFPASLEPS